MNWTYSHSAWSTNLNTCWVRMWAHFSLFLSFLIYDSFLFILLLKVEQIVFSCHAFNRNFAPLFRSIWCTTETKTKSTLIFCATTYQIFFTDWSRSERKVFLFKPTLKNATCSTLGYKINQTIEHIDFKLKFAHIRTVVPNKFWDGLTMWSQVC